MKGKVIKFFVAASVVTVFASVASLAASINIVENSEVVNTVTREVSIDFTTSDIEDTDQITALVYKTGETNSEPKETDVVYIDQNTKGTYNGTLTFEMKDDVGIGTACTLRMGGTGVTNADEYNFTFGELTRDVSVSKTENGIAELSTDTETGNKLTVKKDTVVKLNITPAIGYYISSIKKNGEQEAGSIDAYKGGIYTYTANADAEFTVTFAKITNVTDEITDKTGMTGVDALTLPEVFKGKHEMPALNGNPKDVTVAVVFGQVVPDKTPVEYGIYLTYQDSGEPVRTNNAQIGPYFKAKGKSEDNQFGVLFSGLKVDKYYAQTYVKYGENDISLGIKVPFTVDEYDPVNE